MVFPSTKVEPNKPVATVSGDQNKDVEKETTTTQEENKEPQMLDYLKKYYDENPDLVGWIRLKDTRVNYPVVYVKGDEEFYYLRRNFKKKRDIYGVPFVDGRVDYSTTDNILIHGHETDNGTQFHDFNRYKDLDFYKNHKTFEFDSLYEADQYEVFAVFQDQVYYPTDNVFKYYYFFGSKDKADFDYYISNVKAKSLYDTGITPEYGDKLITISLCDYYVNDGRFVVVARKVSKDDKADKAKTAKLDTSNTSIKVN